MTFGTGALTRAGELRADPGASLSTREQNMLPLQRPPTIPKIAANVIGRDAKRFLPIAAIRTGFIFRLSRFSYSGLSIQETDKTS
jgi:hypothetical protein